MRPTQVASPLRGAPAPLRRSPRLAGMRPGRIGGAADPRSRVCSAGRGGSGCEPGSRGRKLAGDRRAAGCLRAADPARQADRHPAAALADAVGAVDCGPRPPALGADPGPDRRHHPDALGRLCRQRLGRSPLRRACEAHGGAPAPCRRTGSLGSARRRCSTRVLRLPDGSRHQHDDGAAVAAGGRDCDGIPILQAFLRASAGISRHRVFVRDPDGVRGGAGYGAGAWVVDAGVQPVLGDRLRYRVRDGRPRRRRAARPQDLRDRIRALRRGRGHGVLRRLSGRNGVGGCVAGDGRALLRGAARRAGLRALALEADQDADARRLFPGVSAQPLVGLAVFAGIALDFAARQNAWPMFP